MLEAVESRILFAWGPTAALVNQDDALSRFSNLKGQGITVAVIDSGINYNHPALGGGFGAGFKVRAGYDFVDNDADPMDADGHGTEVAGVIAANQFTLNGSTYQGVAPGASLVALRVTHGEDGAADPTIEKALDWVIANHAKHNIRIVNVSLGSGAHTGAYTNTTLSDEFTQLAALNIAVFAASGNEGDAASAGDGIAYPAADKHVFSVGAVNGSDRISSFTQRWTNLDLLAPGAGVPTTNRAGSYEAVDGTSFASPYAAGTAALIAQANPGIGRAEIESILRASGNANKDGDAESGRTTGLSYPRLDILAALNLITERKTNRNNTVGGGAVTSDIAYDPQGILHLAYYDPTIKSIRHATRDTVGNWSKTRIIDTSGADVGMQLSIAIDSTGKPGIAYFDNTNSDLKYAHFNGTGWDVSVRDSTKSVGQSPSLAYDNDGDPVIAYYRKTGGDLKLQTFDANGNWIKLDVDSDGDVGEWADVAVSPDAAIVAVAYNDRTNGNLKYARYLDGQWTIFTVDDLGGGAAYIDLNIHVVETLPQAFISYQDLFNGDLKFAKREDNQWFTETVHTPGNTGQFTSLVFDDDRTAHIAFYSKSKKQLFRADGGFGSWSVVKIGDGGTYLSAATTWDEDVLSFVALDSTRKNLQFGSLV